MKEESVNRAKLGAFVLIGITFLVLGLYFIGSKKNIFHSSIKVSANFNNVGGLLPGNNVRFNGINVGTVSKVYAISDTLIKVEFTVDEDQIQFIHQDALASIGTDGLLGNKLINLTPGRGKADLLKEGFSLRSINPLQIDVALRTLTETNSNLKLITEDLKDISGKVAGRNSLLDLFKDTIFASNVKASIVNLKIMSNQALSVTGDLSAITNDIRKGKGSIGALITDTMMSKQIKQTVVTFKKLSDSVAIISGDLAQIIKNINRGKGSVGVLLKDTMVVHNLNQSIMRIDTAAGHFSDDMEALKHIWPFKKYFKKEKK